MIRRSTFLTGTGPLVGDINSPPVNMIKPPAGVVPRYVIHHYLACGVCGKTDAFDVVDVVIEADDPARVFGPRGCDRCGARYTFQQHPETSVYAPEPIRVIPTLVAEDGDG